MTDSNNFLKAEGQEQLPSAEEQYPDIFVILNEIINQVFHLVHDKPVPEDSTYWGHVRLSLLFRAFNQYRSIVNLLKTNHWEDALILTRSLFELLLYTEELLRHSDVEEVAKRFCLFSELQGYLEFRELTLYKVLTGRLGQEWEVKIKKHLDKEAKKFFSIFWHKNKKGRGKWRESWCNKNRAELSRASGNPMRIHQYYLIYGRGSDFTHSSPIAVFSSFHYLKEGHDFQQFKDLSDSVEEKELKTVAPLASCFLLEIFLLVGDRFPDFDSEWFANTFKSLEKTVFA